ncbi:hypothetical protein VOI32_03225 [Paraburkholderia caribensis]|uniref:Thiolase C-terminal domain-containing protein n=1 Tax=Paraburkholderia caribensis TaxID=75105 RepID=A0ABV0DPB1_9BURK|nr:hypothetical protein [Paraburkholderia caribensis]
MNEAFAVVTMAAMRDPGLPDDQVTCMAAPALSGIQLGASGASLIVTLLSVPETYGLKCEIASFCIGVREVATISELSRSGNRLYRGKVNFFQQLCILDNATLFSLSDR